ncbi:hypothetical protein CsSME_00026772 [Camellia sinensis var. sinensis]
MSGKEDEQAIPLLLDTPSSSSSVQPNGPLIRTGTVWTAIAHVITGVIGSGVLSLAWSVAQLGWIAGPLCIMVFGVIAVVVSYLLCDCYRSPDPQFGPARNPSYTAAVKSYLGEKSMWVCGAFVQESYYGYGVGEQFRNQTVITRKGTMLHVTMGTVYICCYLEQFRFSSLRYVTSITWHGSP